MHFEPLDCDPRTRRFERRVEHAVNKAVRGADAARKRLGLGGRRAPYDDLTFEFDGGPGDRLRRSGYEKSLRLLWKAEPHAPWLGFEDASPRDRELLRLATRALGREERQIIEHMASDEYRQLLVDTYSERERDALVAVLTAICHGEAYAWLVSGELLGELRSTGARAALTMQVMEEAKHFLVLRELIRAFDRPIPRQSAWEYLLMESVLRSRGLEKLFGMNVLIEGIALSFFGLIADAPHLDILRLFHMDEARHAALPLHYFKDFPLDDVDSHSARAKVRRARLILPALALIPHLEEDLAVLGIDAFEFGGSVVRKVSWLADRNGFHLPVTRPVLLKVIDGLFNGYCIATRTDHAWQRFTNSETTRDRRVRQVEQDLVFAH